MTCLLMLAWPLGPRTGRVAGFATLAILVFMPGLMAMSDDGPLDSGYLDRFFFINRPQQPDPAAYHAAEVAAIEREKSWAGRSLEDYNTDRYYRQPITGETRIFTENANCLVKIGYVTQGMHDDDRIWIPWHETIVMENGMHSSVSFGFGGAKGTGGDLKGDRLTRARRLVSAIPAPPVGEIEPLRTIVVGSLVEGAWSVRSYDRDRLPAEVRDLMRLLGFRNWK